jgi:hypothetical protein
VNCLNRFFHMPDFDSLAEKLLKAEAKGVIAAQAVYADTGALDELLAIYHLFGDPTTRLR